jgi:hypothetical protein
MPPKAAQILCANSVTSKEGYWTDNAAASAFNERYLLHFNVLFTGAGPLSKARG